MCVDCWDLYKPAAITPELKNAVAWLCALYKDNSAGGWLHVYVDDWNLPVPATYEEWMTACSEPPNALEVACWEAMKDLTEQEQATAMAIRSSYYQPEGVRPSTFRMRRWGGEEFWPDEAVRAAFRVPCEVCDRFELTYADEALGYWAACKSCIAQAKVTK